MSKKDKHVFHCQSVSALVNDIKFKDTYNIKYVPNIWLISAYIEKQPSQQFCCYGLTCPTNY